MESNRYKGLIVSYFLARCDERAYAALGYGSQLATHRAIASILDVKHNTVKNWRDEFDSVVSNSRRGWHQRSLRPSRAEVLDRFGDLSDQGLEFLVKDILMRTDHQVEVEIAAPLLTPSENDDADEEIRNVGSQRAETGKRAEEIFVDHFNRQRLLLHGALRDCRTLGEGYDFEIVDGEQTIAVEVKGLADGAGGISMTSREWLAARAWKENYIIALVLRVYSTPEIVLLRNPGYRLAPRLSVVQVAQERWLTTASELIQLATTKD